MRIKINIKTPKLPILYRHRFMALIKEALKNSDPEYKDFLYPDKNNEISKRVKPFTFNISFPKARTDKKEKIIIDDGVEVEEKVFYFEPDAYISWYISSSNYEFIMNLYNGLLSIKSFNFNDDITLKLEHCYILKEKQISEDQVVFKTNSPILIEDSNENKNKPLLPINEDGSPLNESELNNFNSHFNEIHDRILKDLRHESPGLFRKLELIPFSMRKQIVKHTIRGFRKHTQKPVMILTTFQGNFKLIGDPRDLQMLYQIGIGLRTGQGFGMVEVV